MTLSVIPRTSSKKSSVLQSDIQIRAAAALRLRQLRAVETFHDLYYSDRVAFAYDILDWDKLNSTLADYQRDKILRALDQHDRVCLRSLHGVGKTFSNALVVWHFALTRDVMHEWKCVTTASVFRQLEHYLWPEIHKLSRYIKWNHTPLGRPPSMDELQTMRLKLSTGQAFAVSCDDPQNIEGAHEDELLYIFDESKAVPDGVFDSAEGAFSHAGSETGKVAKVFAVSTPGDPIGRFYDIQSRKPEYKDWFVTNVTLPEAIAAGRVSKNWADGRKNQWGENDPRYLNRVLGEFSEGIEEGVIPRKWLKLAFDRYRDLELKDSVRTTVAVVGADLADSGNDDTVFAYINAEKVLWELETVAKEEEKAIGINVMKAQHKLSLMLRQSKSRHYPLQMVVDGLGIGASVCGALREIIETEEIDAQLHIFVASHKTDMTDREEIQKFSNKRSAAWWNLRELLDPINGANLAIKYDEQMEKELVAVKFREQAGGVIQVEPKKDLKKATRLGYSPNKADAVVMAYFADAEEGEDAGFWVI